MAYQPGDHLGILPRNSFDAVRRVMARFGLDAGQYVTIIPNSGAHTHLPIEEPTPLVGVLGSCVELHDVASRAALAVLGMEDPEQRAAIAAMAGDDEDSAARYRERIYSRNLSVLDVLDEFLRAACRSRSTSTCCPRSVRASTRSRPLPGQPQHVQRDRGAAAGTGAVGCRNPYRRVLGVRRPDRGERDLFAFVRHPAIPFRPPENPHTPMIMVGAALASRRSAGSSRTVPRCSPRACRSARRLFFGCRNSGNDLLYPEELVAFEGSGVARVERCSDEPGTPRRFVQDAMRARGRGLGPDAT